MNLCLFDLDHTLIPFDSDHAFGAYMVSIGWADAEVFKRSNDQFYADYQAGRLDLNAYVEFATSVWRQRTSDELQVVQQRFMNEVVIPDLQPQALDLVRRHQKAGDLVAIVTATNEFVTQPIAAAFGVEHLIAVQLERDAQGRVTGKIRGTPSFQQGKITRVHEWLSEQGHSWDDFPQTIFYSDSMNDVPLLEQVSEPVATNPAPALRTLAQQQGWRILDLFA